MNQVVRYSKAEAKALYARDLAAFAETGWPAPSMRLCDLDLIEMIDGPPDVILGYDKFRAYQKWMTEAILNIEGVFLAAEMGLGKTAAVLKAIRMLIDLGEIESVLIIAPIHVANETWPEEIAKWAFARGLTYSVITGDENDRRIAVRRKVDIHIINRENVVWLQKHLGRRWKYDMLVYDEASRLKGASKKTAGNVRQDGTKAAARLSEFGALRRMRFSFKRVVLLSGTPAPNGLTDLWGPIYILDMGKRLGQSKTAFLERWFTYDAYKFKHFPHEWSKGEITERISDVFFALKEADYLTLPPKMTIDHWVDLPPKAREIYRRMARDMSLAEFNVEAVNNGVLTNKLLQIANGSLYVEDGDAVRLHEAKLDALDSIIAEAAGQPILLGYEFKFDVLAIKKRFPFARIFGESSADKRDWDRGRIKLLVTHPASAGHGLNFQFGGNIQVWFGLSWSLELYLQFLKRLHRSGQMADRVFVHRILARKTADEAMVRLLDVKGVTQDMITDAVKATVRKEQHELV